MHGNFTAGQVESNQVSAQVREEDKVVEQVAAPRFSPTLRR